MDLVEDESIPFETAEPVEALWRALRARSRRLARLQGEPQFLADTAAGDEADDLLLQEERLWSEFESLLMPGVDLVCVVGAHAEGDRVDVNRPEAILMGATAAVALGLGDAILGDLPVGTMALTVGDVLTLLDPSGFRERLSWLAYLKGQGRLLKTGLLHLEDYDRRDPGSLILTDLVITSGGLDALTGQS